MIKLLKFGNKVKFWKNNLFYIKKISTNYNLFFLILKIFKNN